MSSFKKKPQAACCQAPSTSMQQTQLAARGQSITRAGSKSEVLLRWWRALWQSVIPGNFPSPPVLTHRLKQTFATHILTWTRDYSFLLQIKYFVYKYETKGRTHFPQAFPFSDMVVYCIQNITVKLQEGAGGRHFQITSVGYFLWRTAPDLSVPTGWHCKQV